MIKAIKRLLPVQLKIKILMLFHTAHDPRWEQFKSFNGKRVFVFLAGFYQNLGDMALTYSKRRFLEKLFPNARVIVVPSTQTYAAVKTIKRMIRQDDLVTVLGGGNMDDMYVPLENARLHVIRSFPNNRIVCFPQTMAFSDTPYGRKRQNISRRIYTRHKNLTIFVREKYSLERVRAAFPGVEIGFSPDIVLSLDKTKPKQQRTEVVCCMRSDKEQQTTPQEKIEIGTAIKSIYPNTIFVDTVDVSLDECTPEHYEATLEKFWALLRRSRVVVTDRLHCMIFCVITGTPCVVMDNSNKKISGVYDAWLRKVPYVRMLTDNSVEKVMAAVEELLRTDYDSQAVDFTKEFEELRQACIK